MSELCHCIGATRRRAPFAQQPSDLAAVPRAPGGLIPAMVRVLQAGEASEGGFRFALQR